MKRWGTCHTIKPVRKEFQPIMSLAHEVQVLQTGLGRRQNGPAMLVLRTAWSCERRVLRTACFANGLLLTLPRRQDGPAVLAGSITWTNACALPCRWMAAQRHGGAAVPNTEALAAKGCPSAGRAGASASSRHLPALVQRPQAAYGARRVNSCRGNGASTTNGNGGLPPARRIRASHDREATTCSRRSILVRAGY